MNFVKSLLIGLGLIVAHPSLAMEGTSADSAAAMLTQAGYEANFSFESLEVVERFMKENSDTGQATPNGHLTTEPEMKLLGIGLYVGEVMRRKLDGEWRGDDDDPVNLEIHFGGHIIWPVQRVLKRFYNGEEDNVWDYARAIARDAGKY